MFRTVLGSLVTEIVRVPSYVKNAPLIQRVMPGCVSVRNFSDLKDKEQLSFDVSLLEYLVCPLSKKPLSYDSKTNELINKELGIAYSISDGIPNMIPQEARLIEKDTDTSTTPTQG